VARPVLRLAGHRQDILKRPFITVGFAALVLMIPLAASSNFAIRRLGGRKWQSLHRAIYPIAMLGCLHFWWLVKKDITEPLVYSVIPPLLGLRMWWREQERRQQPAPACPRARSSRARSSRSSR
jgi:sulfoxide reductase heme-binding subunit YedZ